MDPIQNWLNQAQLFPLMPPPEQIALFAGALSLVSSLAMDSPLSSVLRIGQFTGS